MEVGEDLDDLAALRGGQLLTEVPSDTVEERVHAERVALVEATDGVALSRQHWCDDAVEAALGGEGLGRAERDAEAVKGRVACGTEPGLVVEVVDGHEVVRAAGVPDLPVVAAEADREVVDRRWHAAPSRVEGREQQVGVEPRGQLLHSETVGSSRSLRCLARCSASR